MIAKSVSLLSIGTALKNIVGTTRKELQNTVCPDGEAEARAPS